MSGVGRRIRLEGRVQGVGFRPFVYRLATELRLTGWVQNLSGRVVVEVSGAEAELDHFERRLIEDAPPFAAPHLVERATITLATESGFTIRESDASDDVDIHVPPDVSVCDDCRRELQDPEDRRYRYPFINCTQCGPRATLIDALPYDRARTTMAAFDMCEACRAEYEDPADRRFHAEPIACPQCGPRLSWTPGNAGTNDEVLDRAIAALRDGAILGVKGVGGYHLVCDATCAPAVARLRARKGRPTKPFAVMVPAPRGAPLVHAEALVELDDGTRDALLSAARPIVLAPRRPDGALADGVADGLGDLGVMLAYSPLHDLLLEGLGGPVVATSGNTSGEPLAYDVDTAVAQLADVADGFVHHDRAIFRPMDDAVVRRIAGAVRPLRLGRGLAPLELELGRDVAAPTLALGGHQKNTVALAWGRRAVVSPHLGDLDSPAAVDRFEATVAGLAALFDVRPERLVVDHHPDYASHRYARRRGLPTDAVWHHHAHASAVAAEAPDVSRWLVLTWDGVGLGEGGALWGGEMFVGAPGAWRRAASFAPLAIVGASRAGREPWRAASALCWGADVDYTPPVDAADFARAAWRAGRTSTTSAVGRIFDAAASLILGHITYGHEAEGPMALEAAAARYASPDDPRVPFVPLPLVDSDLLRADPTALVPVLRDEARSHEERSAILHASLVEAAVAQVRAIHDEARVEAIGLGGGVFQNRWLTERLVHRLTSMGVRVVIPSRVPVNDGGLAYGQLVEHLARME